MSSGGITVFVPAFNEVTTLRGAVSDVLSVAATTGCEVEVLIVDDGSTDGTGELADVLLRSSRCIRVIHHATNLGLAAGYRHALAAATMPSFTFVPADREVSRESLVAMFWLIGLADIVVPYHANPQARPWLRRLLTWVSTALLNWVSGHRLRYYQGPCIYPTALVRSLPATGSGFFFLAELLVHALWRGATYVEVGIVHTQRTTGRSQAVSIRNVGRAVATVARLWWIL